MFNIFKKNQTKNTIKKANTAKVSGTLDSLKAAQQGLDECFETSKENAAKLMSEFMYDSSEIEKVREEYKDPKDQMECFLNSMIPDICKETSHLIKFCFTDKDFFTLPEFPREAFLKTKGNINKLEVLHRAIYKAFPKEAVDKLKFPPMPLLIAESVITQLRYKKLVEIYGIDALAEAESFWDYEVKIVLDILDEHALNPSDRGLWESTYAMLDNMSDRIYKTYGKQMYNKREYMDLIPEKVETF